MKLMIPTYSECLFFLFNLVFNTFHSTLLFAKKQHFTTFEKTSPVNIMFKKINYAKNVLISFSQFFPRMHQWELLTMHLSYKKITTNVPLQSKSYNEFLNFSLFLNRKYITFR